VKSEDDRLADFLNEDPIAFMNCNSTEMMTSVGAAFICSIPIAVLAGIALQNGMIAFVITLILTILFSWAFMEYLSRIREKHHNAWFKEKILLLKIKHGFNHSPFINATQRYRRGKRNG
jgi:conjugative transfer region protein (TIGR03750 family)